MTQRELVLSFLRRESDGLTSVELSKLTGIPKHSLRTVVWELRRDGLVDVVGGVRGKWRYGLTEKGEEHAPAPPDDYVDRKVASGMFGPLSGLGRFPLLTDGAAAEKRRLTSFVRWLLIVHPELFASDAKEARLALEKAITEYVSESFESLFPTIPGTNIMDLGSG